MSGWPRPFDGEGKRIPGRGNSTEGSRQERASVVLGNETQPELGVPHTLGGMVGNGLQGQQCPSRPGLVAMVRNLAFV